MTDSKTCIEDGVTVEALEVIHDDGDSSKVLRRIVVVLNFSTILVNLIFIVWWVLVLVSAKEDLLDLVDTVEFSNTTMVADIEVAPATLDDLRRWVIEDFDWAFFTIPPMAVLLIGILTACFANYGIISGQQFWPVAAHAALALVTAAFFGGYKVVFDIVWYYFHWMWVCPLIWAFAFQMIPNALLARKIRNN